MEHQWHSRSRLRLGEQRSDLRRNGDIQ